MRNIKNFLTEEETDWAWSPDFLEYVPGREFASALEAAEAMSKRWGSAGHVRDLLTGRINFDPDQFQTCSAHVWTSTTGGDFGFRLWPCTGGVIQYSDGQIWATESKADSLRYVGIAGRIVKEDKMPSAPDDEWSELVRPLYEASEHICTPEPSEGYGDELTHNPWVWAKYIQAVWVQTHGRAPKAYDLLGGNILGSTEVERTANLIRQANLKVWLRYASKMQDSDLHARIALLELAGKYGIAELEQMLKYEAGWNNTLSRFGKIDKSRIKLLSKSQSQEFVRALGAIPLEVELSNWSVEKVVLEGAQYCYDAVTDRQLAKVCQAAGLSQYDFEQYQEYWTKRFVKTAECIPAVTVTDGEMTMRRLDSDDPMGPLLGVFTNCCQHPEGAGQSCAKHGMENPQGGFFVVEKSGKLIAQSWAWRNGATMVFDSIETLSNAYDDQIVGLYTIAANLIVGKLGIDQVNVGHGYGTTRWKNQWASANAVAAPSGCYTDARNQCVIAQEVAHTW